MARRKFHSARISGDGPVQTSGASTALLPWWSFTKTALAIAALRLVEAGRLELDAPRPGKPYSLRQLLTHRAGVPNYAGLETYHRAVAAGEEAWSRARLLAEVGAEKLVFEPGSGWAYSNVGYMFVADAIEEASGLPLAAALRRLALDPLGLAATHLAEGPSGFRDVHWPALRRYDPRWVYHGCLIGPAGDAARLLHALSKGEILGPDLASQMQERFTPMGRLLPGRPAIEAGYGMGLMIGRMGDAGRVLGHSGDGPGSVSAVWHFPGLDRPVTVAVFSEGVNVGAAECEAQAIALAEMAGS